MATTFKDKKGRVWDLSLDLYKAEIVDKSDFKRYWDREFSILVLDEGLVRQLLTNAPFLFAIIWAIVQDQAEAKFKYGQEWSARHPISPDTPPAADCFPLSPREQAEAAQVEFVSGVNGPTIEAARNAIMEALGDFFPEQRTVLLALAEQMKRMQVKAGQKLTETMPLLDKLLDKEFDDKVEKLKRELLGEKPGETSSLSPPTVESDTAISSQEASPSVT